MSDFFSSLYTHAIPPPHNAAEQPCHHPLSLPASYTICIFIVDSLCGACSMFIAPTNCKFLCRPFYCCDPSYCRGVCSLVIKLLKTLVGVEPCQCDGVSTFSATDSKMTSTRCASMSGMFLAILRSHLKRDRTQALHIANTIEASWSDRIAGVRPPLACGTKDHSDVGETAR